MIEYNNLIKAVSEFVKLVSPKTNMWHSLRVNIYLDDNGELKVTMPMLFALKDEWIKYSEKQPEKDGRYLVCEKHCTKWIGVVAMRNGKFDVEITHWMPLPSPPKENK